MLISASRARRPLGALALALLAAACGEELSPEPSVAPVAAPPSSPSATPAAAAPAGTVTLVTGDRVTLRERAGRLAPQIEAGPGRAHLAFSIRERAGEVSVIPRDVEPLLAAGQLDRALFNVSRLLAEGYGDDARDDLPLLLTGAPHGASGLALRGQLAARGVRVVRALPGLGVLALRQHKHAAGAALAQLTAPGVKASAAPRLWLDRKRHLLIDQSAAQVGAPAAHARGYTGAGVTVAVLDTGLDAAHPDLAGKIAAAATFVDDGAGPGDVRGHGTHVASIIAGSGAASGGARRGIAPDATLLDGRVCGASGACFDSAVLAGMEWATAHGARIINLSLGGADGAEVDPLEQAIDTLSAEHGVLFVASAGNGGFTRYTVSSPSSADAALSVGSVGRDERRASSSGQGPRVGDDAIKPDLTAPGVGIVAARAAGTSMGAPVDAFYTRASGTSMAAPHVSAAAAILLQQHPSWSGAQLKAALMASAQPSASLTVYQQGAGRLDVERATRQLVTATPASLSFGVAAFPHDDDPPVTRLVRYRNDGAAPITLALEAALRAESGAAAPAGMISLEPATITIAAGGTAEVALTVDTRPDAPDGTYGGALLATSAADGAPALRLLTPIGVKREPEMHDLTVSVLGRDGQPASTSLSLVGLGQDGEPSAGVALDLFVSDQDVVRLPAGTYHASAFFDDEPVLLATPRLALDAPTALVLDGRQARSLELTLPEGELDFVSGMWDFEDPVALVSSAVIAPSPLFTAEVGAAAPPGEVYSIVSALYASADASRVYHVAHLERDHILTGWQQTLRRRDLAIVDAHHAGPAGRLMIKTAGALPSVGGFLVGLSPPPYTAPFQRTEHYYGPDFTWYVEAAEALPHPSFPELAFPILTLDTMRDYRPGQRAREPWNQAPLGPAFPATTLYSLTPDRSGAPRRLRNLLALAPSLFSDPPQPTHSSRSATEGQHVRLLRNGQPFAEAPPTQPGILTPIPDDVAEYRLEATATRPADLFELSRQVSAAWTFQAGAGADVAVLPLPTLRFSPPLDAEHRSRAPALALPVRIERPPGAAAPPIREARVEVSFDDGATWSRVPLLRVGEQALGLILHPRDATHVSLRGEARDAAGNAVELSILRAYALAPR